MSAAIRDAVADGDMKLLRTLDFSRQESFCDVDAFLDRIVAIDPSRREAALRNRALLSERLREVALRRDGGWVLDQPHKAVVLAKQTSG